MERKSWWQQATAEEVPASSLTHPVATFVFSVAVSGAVDAVIPGNTPVGCPCSLVIASNLSTCTPDSGGLATRQCHGASHADIRAALSGRVKLEVTHRICLIRWEVNAGHHDLSSQQVSTDLQHHNMANTFTDHALMGEKAQISHEEAIHFAELTPEEKVIEKKLRRKIDALIMPLVVLVYLMNYIDR